MLDTASKSLQIVAILVAGVRGLWTWQQTTAPSLAAALNVVATSTATWRETIQACDGILNLEIENPTSSRIRITNAPYIIKSLTTLKLPDGKDFALKNDLNQAANPTAIALGSGNLIKSSDGNWLLPKTKASSGVAYLVAANEERDVLWAIDLYGDNNALLSHLQGQLARCSKATR